MIYTVLPSAFLKLGSIVVAIAALWLTSYYFECRKYRRVNLKEEIGQWIINGREVFEEMTFRVTFEICYCTSTYGRSATIPVGINMKNGSFPVFAESHNSLNMRGLFNQLALEPSLRFRKSLTCSHKHAKSLSQRVASGSSKLSFPLEVR